MKMTLALDALAALAQETRLRVFRLLVQEGPGGLSAGEISTKLKLAPATLTFHATQLRHAGLVTSKREGRNILYRANFDSMNALMAYLTENCCQGDACEVTETRCAPANEATPAKPARRRNA